MKRRRRLAVLLGSLLAGAGLVLTAPATDAAVYIRTNTTPMTLTGGQAASTPEFTALNVYGTGTTITDVNLVLTGLTHTNPDDLDIELVHAVTLSTSTAVALMSDVCGATNLSNVNLTLDDQAVNELPDSSACTSGTWQPNNVDSATDSFVVPVAGSALAAFNGAPATGQWGVYVRDDSTGADVGSLAGWTLQITTAADATITIPGPLSTNGGGVAGPYPVAIPVTGQTGTVTDVNLTLPGLTHTLPTDIDMLLVGPGGQKVLVMSDACGNDSNNATLILDDQAPVSLNSASGTCISGSYKPTNFGGADTFDAPAPVGPYADAMAAFNGGQANGTWLLFVRDDTVSYDTGWLLGAPTLTVTTGTTGVTDVTAPDTKITKKPKTGFKRSSKVKFASNEAGVTFECKVDSKKFKPCSSPLKLKNLRFGKHQIQVRAIDAAGNVDGSPARANWKVKKR